ncbi:hypothetical protein DL89DRAFT_295796 [Linderina pennispora]|uniref:Rhodanese domain-containing protein n=1 Tax=Linderina pennispora TaxID=61395 RepID=A0A1Y1VXA9_9FUNG|nr:uncharacterized protein DL89DRAFT_295796 [Linderina pennispora]ORX65927.1 hypothetical protein DL89DRAFT_295796 [Linderina pennispora]
MAVSNRITVDKLAELVRDPTKIAGKDYVVVDVRNSDYNGGHIPGAVNVPAHEMHDQAAALVRGPKSARIYNEANIQVLTGGQR